MALLLKRTFAIFAYYLKLWSFFAWIEFQKSGRPILAVFTFHRILDIDPSGNFLQGYERGQSFESYKKELDVIEQNFRVVSLNEFVSIVMGEKKVNNYKPIALLTFDDADSDHGRLAFDELAKRDICGLSFVPTGFIETVKKFYHLRLTNLCNNLNNDDWKEITSTDIHNEIKEIVLKHLPDCQENKQEMRKDFINLFHILKPSVRDKILDGWEQKIDKYDLGIESMNWDEIKKYSVANIAIGSHTVSHNRLELLTNDEVRFELAESKKILEDKMGTAIDTISYPEGSYNKDVIEMLRDSNYKIAFTTDQGLISYPLNGDDHFKLPRLNFSGGSKAWLTYSFGVRFLKKIFASKKTSRKDS